MNTLQKVSADTHIAKLIKWAKQIFNAARKRKLITEGPFDDVKGGNHVNNARQYFVTVDDANALLGVAPLH